MEMSTNSLLILGLFCGILAHTYATQKDGQRKEEEFDVKPAGSILEFQQTLDGVTCTFTYAATGGTNEKWLMALTSSKDQTDYTCMVYRPDRASYLFFMQFQLQVTGAKLTKYYLENEPGKLMNREEYIVGDSSDNFVQQNDAKFGSKLAKVEITAKKAKGEL